MLQVEESTARILQKGLRDRLLCQACEAHFSREYEEPFAKSWPNALPDRVDTHEIHLPIDDYTRFKLFHLGNLWRASISGRREFGQASLGSTHTERIREMLVHVDPGRETEYQILANVLVEPDTRKPAVGQVLTPVKKRADGRVAYNFMYGGCVWHIIVSSNPLPAKLADFVLSPTRDLRAGVFELGSEFDPARLLMETYLENRWNAGLSPVRRPGKRKKP